MKNKNKCVLLKYNTFMYRGAFNRENDILNRTEENIEGTPCILLEIMFVSNIKTKILESDFNTNNIFIDN